MKHSTVFWIVFGVVPSIIVFSLAAYAARHFEHTQDALFLYQFFIILLTLAAMSVTIFSFFAIVAHVKSADIRTESLGRLPLSAWLNMAASILIGVLWGYAASRLGLGFMWSSTIGILVFVGYLLGPISKKITKQLQSEANTTPVSTLPVVSENVDNASKSDEAPIGGETIVNTSMTSNVMVNVVVQTPQTEERPKEAKLDTPPRDKLETEDAPVQDTTNDADDSSTKPDTQAANDEAPAEDNAEQDSITDEDSTPADIPADLPKELNRYPIIVIFRELANEQILTSDFKLETSIKTVTNGQLALLADLIGTWFGISNKWKVFEAYWGLKNMGQAYKQVKEQELALPLYKAIARAHKDVRINGIKVITDWIRLYELRNHINQGLR